MATQKDRTIMNINKRTVLLLSVCAITALGGCFGGLARSNISIDMDQLAGKANLMPIAIIGSGPAGLMAAVYGARGGKRTYVIEGNKPGGLLMDTTEVENWPGEIMITGPKIIEKLQAQAAHHNVQFIDDAIERIDGSSWPYKLITENGQEFHALTIIIATGASPRRLLVPGEEDYWGAGVTSCAVCDAPFYKGQEVVVVGGGDSAVEEAIQLSAYADKITILVRKGAMRAASSMQERLKNYSQVSIKYNVEVRKILGDDTQVTGIELYNSVTKQTENMATNGVFLAIGHDPNTKFVKELVATDSSGYIQVKGRTQATSMPAIFAAGDVEDHRYRQAGSSAGYGTDAGLDAVRFLDDHGFNPTIASSIKPQLYNGQKGAESIHSISSDTVRPLETLDQFNELSGKKGVVVMDFWSETCPSCKQMLPLFKSVSQEYADQAAFATVDADRAEEVVEKFFVHKVPCLLVFQDGNLVARYSDTMSRKELSTFVGQFINAQA